jgi:hypothetical protein
MEISQRRVMEHMPELMRELMGVMYGDSSRTDTTASTPSGGKKQ